MLSTLFGLLLGAFFIRRLQVRSRGWRLLAIAALLIGDAPPGAAIFIGCAVMVLVLVYAAA